MRLFKKLVSKQRCQTSNEKRSWVYNSGWKTWNSPKNNGWRKGLRNPPSINISGIDGLVMALWGSWFKLQVPCLFHAYIYVIWFIYFRVLFLTGVTPGGAFSFPPYPPIYRRQLSYLCAALAMCTDAYGRASVLWLVWTELLLSDAFPCMCITTSVLPVKAP